MELFAFVNPWELLVIGIVVFVAVRASACPA